MSSMIIAMGVSLLIVSVLMLFFAYQDIKKEELIQKFKTKLTDILEQKEELAKKIPSLEQANSLLSQKLENAIEYKAKYEALQNNFSLLKQENAKLQTKIEEEEKSFNDKLKLLEESKSVLKSSFENLANEVLEKSTKKIQEQSTQAITSIVAPLSTQLKDFKDRIENLSKEEAKELSALQNELKNLKELSFKLSKEAQDLTNALKGESKTQGVWGEMVLQRVLELSGLKEGREYKKEVVLKDSNNQIYRPDVIVYLPNHREVIIDAKTSLVAYKRYIESENEEIKKGFLKAHVASIKRHIDTLSEKKYENLKGINSLDFVFMFIPIENALMVALEADDTLFEYAFKRKVVLVTPTTLLVSLRAIESSWRYEYQAKNIAEVIKNAEALYDKVRGFVEDFEKVGDSLDSAKESYHKAFKKLSSGKGNVIRQVEKLKEKANIKPKKSLPKKFLEESASL